MAQNTSPTPSAPGRWSITEFGAPSVLKWVNFNPDVDFKLEAGQVLVKILVTGISGVDNLQRVGGYPNPRAHVPGITPGYDFVGEIEAVGQDVPSTHTVGTRVASMSVLGGDATHIVIPHADLLPIAPTDDPIKVATLPLNYMTAFGMLHRAGVELKSGDTILMTSAAGGLATALAQIITSFKLGIRMLGTTTPPKFDYVRSLGVEPLDRNDPELVQKVLDLTGGKGVDAAFDAVSSQASIGTSFQTIKKEGGRFITVGIMDFIDKEGKGMTTQITKEGAEANGLTVFLVDANYKDTQKEQFDKDFYTILEKVRSGDLDPLITKLWRLKDIVPVHEELIAAKNVKGKMLFVVDEKLAAEKGI